MGKGSRAYSATQRFKTEFGDEAVVILAQGELQRLVLTANLNQFVKLEGCIGGKAPSAKALAALPAAVPRAREAEAGARGLRAGDVHQHRDHRRRGLHQAEARPDAAGGAGRVQPGARRCRRSAATRPPSRSSSARRPRAWRSSRPSSSSSSSTRATGSRTRSRSQFVAQLVFDPARGANTPKQRFAYLFPSDRAAMITIRLRPDLSDAAADAGDRPDPAGGRATRPSSSRTRARPGRVSGVPGRRRGPGEGGRTRDLRAAGAGGPGDGAGAGARVPHADAAAAARAGDGRRPRSSTAGWRCWAAS